MSSEWQEAVDKQTRRVYLYRAATRETKWKTIGNWEVFQDPATQKQYYVNKLTRQTQWAMPDVNEETSSIPVTPSAPQLQTSHPLKVSGSDHKASLDEATTLSSEEPVRQPSPESEYESQPKLCKHMSTPPSLPVSTSDWKKIVDRDTGRIFFYNKSTGETRFDEPQVQFWCIVVR